jgi:hypothetical protein
MGVRPARQRTHIAEREVGEERADRLHLVSLAPRHEERQRRPVPGEHASHGGPSRLALHQRTTHVHQRHLLNHLAGARLRKCSQLRTLRSATYLDPRSKGVPRRAGRRQEVLIERERFCDGYLLVAD